MRVPSTRSWDPDWGTLCLETLRERFAPAEEYRVSPNTYEPGTAFSGFTRHGSVFVLAGSCRFRFGGTESHLTAGEILDHGKGEFEFAVLGDARCECVHVWSIGEMLHEGRADSWVKMTIWGESFSPAEAIRRTGLPLTSCDEPEAIRTRGHFKGSPRPYGAASLCVADSVAPDQRLQALRDLVLDHLGELRVCGATDMVVCMLDLNSIQGNGELSTEEIAALASLDLPLAMTILPPDEDDEVSPCSLELAWVCCLCGESGDPQAGHTVDIIVDRESGGGIQYLLAHPACLLKRLHSSIPSLIEMDENHTE